MRIAAFDLSLSSPGYAVWDGSRIADSGALAVPRELRSMARLRWILGHVRRISAGADLVAIEGYAYSAANQAHQLGELGGVVRLALFCAGTKYIDVGPAPVKKFATGKGNAEKDQMMLQVYRRFGIEAVCSDQADAVAIAHVAAALHGEWTPTTSEQQQVIEQLRNPAPKKRKLGKRKSALQQESF